MLKKKKKKKKQRTRTCHATAMALTTKYYDNNWGESLCGVVIIYLEQGKGVEQTG